MRTVTGPVRVAGAVTAGALAVVGGLHGVWARGSWPLADRAELADAVVGVAPEEAPTAAMCGAVAGLLGAAAYLVGARSGVLPAVGPERLRRAGAGTVAGVLLARGVLGPVVFGGGLVPRTERFRRLELRCYAPLCVALGTGAAVVARGGR
ncbi:DUF3995 domain-containing protein [Kitasatospora sp. NBC_01539]|uniref:DUF3995 domain-containing protein n=1 Tax=Kitasatospora sp. NBC_01539 TaxID=2903577 RepID=UPI0038602366